MQFLFTDNCFVSLHYTPALYWFRHCLSVSVCGVVNYLVIYVLNRPRCLFSAPPTLTRSQDGKRITISPPETLHTTLRKEMSSPSEAQWSCLKQDRFLLWRIWKSGRSTLKMGWWCLILSSENVFLMNRVKEFSTWMSPCWVLGNPKPKFYYLIV